MIVQFACICLVRQMCRVERGVVMIKSNEAIIGPWVERGVVMIKSNEAIIGPLSNSKKRIADRRCRSGIPQGRCFISFH